MALNNTLLFLRNCKFVGNTGTILKQNKTKLGKHHLTWHSQKFKDDPIHHATKIKQFGFSYS